jgi:hypothetical protein
LQVSSRSFSYYNVTSEDINKFKEALEDVSGNKETFMVSS